MNFDAPTHCHACWLLGCLTPSVRPLGNEGYCINHLGALYATFDPANLDPDIAFGYQTGDSMPEWGLMYADLSCCRCGAGWTGVPGEQCQWCRDGQESLQQHHAQLVLRPPDVRPNDEQYTERMKGWIKRMAVAAKAGLITEKQARAAWRRSRPKTAA